MKVPNEYQIFGFFYFWGSKQDYLVLLAFMIGLQCFDHVIAFENTKPDFANQKWELKRSNLQTTLEIENCTRKKAFKLVLLNPKVLGSDAIVKVMYPTTLNNHFKDVQSLKQLKNRLQCEFIGSLPF